jgi:Flp pilus assembly protein TadD
LGTKAIERDPLQPNSYRNHGLSLLGVNRDAEAEVAFRKALELEPDGAFRHQALGLALVLQGKNNAALREMQQETEEVVRKMAAEGAKVTAIDKAPIQQRAKDGVAKMEKDGAWSGGLWEQIQKL